MAEDLDRKFGTPRDPDEIKPWEDRQPESLSEFDIQVAETLTQLEVCVQQPLLRHAARVNNYLWAIDFDGTIKIAVEELAEYQAEADYIGFPLLRGFTYEPEPKKLGHPALLAGGQARIAGELAFDYVGDKLRWIMNPNSGRYCKINPPAKEQIDAAAALFESYGLAVYVDYL